MKNKNFMKSIIATVVFLVLIGAMLLVYSHTRPKPAENEYSKTITVLVAQPEEEAEEFVIKTDAGSLRQALDQEKLIKGNESTFGFYITEVNNLPANEDNQEWWCITKRGETVFTGVDEILIEDGDQYELTLTEGY